MLCLPAFAPVANEAHAVGDSGECVVVSVRITPFFASAEMFGSLPSAIHCSTRCGSIPSNPRMRSFCEYFDVGLGDEPEQAMNASVATLIADARSRVYLSILSWGADEIITSIIVVFVILVISVVGP